MRTRGSASIGLVCIALHTAFAAMTARTAEIVWTNTSGGDWSVSTNWSPNQVPMDGDAVVITNDGTYTITLDVNSIIDALILGGANGTQTLTNSSRSLLSDSITVNAKGILAM